MREPTVHEEVRREMSRNAGPGRGMRAQQPVRRRSSDRLRLALTVWAASILLAVGICLLLGN